MTETRFLIDLFFGVNRKDDVGILCHSFQPKSCIHILSLVHQKEMKRCRILVGFEAPFNTKKIQFVYFILTIKIQSSRELTVLLK